MPPYREQRGRLSAQRSLDSVRPGAPDDESARQSYVRELARGPRSEPADDGEQVRAQSSLSPRAAARRLVEALIERGVDTFFGIPGGPVCPVFEAIRLEPRAKLVESRHESHAAFAATLYQRCSGRVPAVVVTAGPGITNAVTGIASASLERASLLVIAGDVAWATSGGVMAQDSGPEGIDMESLLSPITRAQVRAANARSVVSQAMRALDIAQDPLNPGPVLFVLPLDRAMEQCDAIEVVAPARGRALPPPAHAVAKTAAWLLSAQRPLIVLGAGCRGHEQAARDLIDVAALPFATTPRAKGLVSELHPWSLRNAGMAASLWARKYTAEPVDACLVLGTDLDDTSMGPTRFAGPGARVIHVDRDARVFGRNLSTQLAVTSDVGTFASALARHIEDGGLHNPRAARALSEAKLASPFDVPEPGQDRSHPIRPHRLLAEVEMAIGPGARFVTDIGEHMLFCLHYLTARSSDSFHVQLNLGSMGSGIAGAIGLSLSDRARRVVCVAGDGGMQMSGMEALVAVRERLPILFVVFNDGRYNMVHHGMRQIFGEANQYATPHIDFAGWARAFGMPAEVVTEPGSLTRFTVNRLLAHGGPALIDARIDASIRIRGGGRVEALQHMSMLSQKPREERS